MRIYHFVFYENILSSREAERTLPPSVRTLLHLCCYWTVLLNNFHSIIFCNIFEEQLPPLRKHLMCVQSYHNRSSFIISRKVLGFGSTCGSPAGVVWRWECLAQASSASETGSEYGSLESGRSSGRNYELRSLYTRCVQTQDSPETYRKKWVVHTKIIRFTKK